MPKLKTETLGPGDLSWIGPDSAKAGRTEWLDTADTAFADHTVGGVILSGTPLALVSGRLKPYDAAGTGSAAVLIGFLYTDQPVNVGKLGVPVFDQGRVDITRLPKTFVAPDPDGNATNVTFMKGA